MQRGVGERVVLERPPVGRHAEHDRAAAVLRVVLEELDEVHSLGQCVFAVVAEAEAPYGHDRFALVALVGLVLGDVHAVAEEPPVLHDAAHLAGAQAAQVVHDGICAAEAVGALAAILEDHVELPEALVAEDLAGEPLHEHAVDTVILHPLEVPEDRF